MARIRITFYKHSFWANVVGFLGTMLSFIGIVFVVLGVMDLEIGIILMGILFVAGGIGCHILANKLNVPKAERNPGRPQAAAPQNQPFSAPGFREINVIRQRNPSESGAACLCMILDYYGMQTSLDQLCRECGAYGNGANASEIVRAAQRRGLNCRDLRIDAAQLRNINSPVIISWQYNRFVILEKAIGSLFSIVDPAVGRYRLDLDSVQRDYSGLVLTFDRSR